MFRRLTIQVTLNAGGSYQKPSLPVQEVEKGMWEKKYEKKICGRKSIKIQTKKGESKKYKKSNKRKNKQYGD